MNLFAGSYKVLHDDEKLLYYLIHVSFFVLCA